MISKEEIVEKVGVLLKELTEKFEYISDPNKDVNPLEFQLFEINAAYFAEHANLLRKLEDEEARGRVEVESETEAPEKAVKGVEPSQLKTDDIVFTPASTTESVEEEALDSQDTVEEIKEHEAVTEDDAVSENKEVSKNEENVAEKEDVSSEDEVSAEIENITDKEQVKTQEEPASERKVEPAAVSEPAKEVSHEVVIEEKTLNVAADRPMSLNDRLSGQRQAMDSEKKHLESPRRIKDIKVGINLNDKLLFIKDLFNGYSLAYSEAIELLNRFESFEDADRFLKSNYAQKNNWDAKPASVEKLYAILRQRYG
jgi:hypothetical protein